MVPCSASCPCPLSLLSLATVLWLPDLIGAAHALSLATAIIDQDILPSWRERTCSGTVVLGTVFGAIHNTGKDMVGSLLTSEGFQVHDPGVNVSARTFMEAIGNHETDILATSAFLTIIGREQKTVITSVEREGLRDNGRIMVSGGATTADFASRIGGDGYDLTAVGAVRLAEKLMRDGRGPDHARGV